MKNLGEILIEWASAVTYNLIVNHQVTAATGQDLLKLVEDMRKSVGQNPSPVDPEAT